MSNQDDWAMSHAAPCFSTLPAAARRWLRRLVRPTRTRNTVTRTGPGLARLLEVSRSIDQNTSTYPNMKTSHQLARELLVGPDLPIFIATRSSEEPFGEATVSKLSGYDSPNGGDDVEAIELHAKQDASFSMEG